MRRALVSAALTAAMVVAPAGFAGATHTGCEHHTTGTAHSTVPHRNQGTHHAHGSIPYCPPEDAPRHMQDGGH